MQRPLLLIFTTALLVGGSAYAASPPSPSRFSGGGQLLAAGAQSNGTLTLDARLHASGLAPPTDQKQATPAKPVPDAPSLARFTFAGSLRDKDAGPDGAGCVLGDDMFRNGFE